MTHLIEVAFGGNRKAFFQWEGETPPPLRTAVIVEADRGEDLGHVHATGELAQTRCNGCSHGCGTAPPPTDRALRAASDEDVASASMLPDENETARRTSHERARAAGLVMKISDAEWQWDRRKLTLFFTAERRIDFRALVRELAAVFRTRIELKQIGVRDEAKRLSGIGRCGREYCSASWLPDLRPVNLGVAKDQKLSLNPTQISGACGRLMCCLRYEHEFYVQSRRRFPKEGKILRTATGEEKVMTCDIFRDTVTLRSPEGDTRVVPLAALREEVDAAGGGPLSAGPSAPPEPRQVAESEDEAAPEGVEPAVTAMVDEAPVAEVPVAEAPVAEASAVEASADESQAADDPSPEQQSDTSDTEPPPRKRRRGRRGGRRMRGERGPRDTNDEPPSTPPSDS